LFPIDMHFYLPLTFQVVWNFQLQRFKQRIIEENAENPKTLDV